LVELLCPNCEKLVEVTNETPFCSACGNRIIVSSSSTKLITKRQISEYNALMTAKIENEKMGETRLRFGLTYLVAVLGGGVFTYLFSEGKIDPSIVKLVFYSTLLVLLGLVTLSMKAMVWVERIATYIRTEIEDSTGYYYQTHGFNEVKTPILNGEGLKVARGFLFHWWVHILFGFLSTAFIVPLVHKIFFDWEGFVTSFLILRTMFPLIDPLGGWQVWVFMSCVVPVISYWLVLGTWIRDYYKETGLWERIRNYPRKRISVRAE